MARREFHNLLREEAEEIRVATTQAHMDVQGGSPLTRDAAGGMRRIHIDIEQSILPLQMEVA
jgi:hypothetical protein